MGTLDSALVPPEAGLRKMASLYVWSEFQKCQAHPYISGKDGAVNGWMLGDERGLVGCEGTEP